MKRLISLVLSIMLVFSCLTIAVSADTTSTTVEYLEDGSYIVTEFTISNSLARTSKSGTKSSTYYNSNDKRIFTTSVTGYFDYTYGESATATRGSVSVIIHDSSATFVEKFANPSGNTVYGYGCVLYLNAKRSLSPKITCDVYGNLS